MTRFKLARIAAVPLALALLAAAAPAPAPTDQAAANRVRGHVQFLASDELEGRGTGSSGYSVAAAYVAAQFASLGLKPGGTNGGWYLQVPFRRASHSSPPQLSVTAGKEARSLAAGIEFAVEPSLIEKVRSIDAPMVFVGHGIRDSRLGIDDYAGLDVRGKAVVALSGTPPGLATDVAAHLAAMKHEAAAELGAVAVVEIPADASGARARSFGFFLRPRVDWIDSTGRTGRDGRLRARVAMSRPGAERLFEGAPTPLAAVWARNKAKLAVRGFELPGRLSIRAESQWQDFSSPEVIGLLPGADPRLAHEYVVLMAHLDHLGIREGAKAGEDAIYNGALDNAAGIATMIEAVREFTESGKPPRRSILFIANTGEELGLLGADYFAAHPTVPLKQVVGAVDLDMPLLLYDFTDVIAFGADHSSIVRTVEQAALGLGISVSPDPMPEQSIFVRSDHYQFVRRGVPAILLFTGYANGGKARWDHFFANTYHTPKDDLAQPINWNSGARYAKLNYAIARLLADSDGRPLWYRGDYFGDTFAPGAPRAEPRPGASAGAAQ